MPPRSDPRRATNSPCGESTGCRQRERVTQTRARTHQGDRQPPPPTTPDPTSPPPLHTYPLTTQSSRTTWPVRVRPVFRGLGLAPTYNQLMQARVHVLTLAVADLERALGFYRDGLGLESPGVIATEFSGDSTTPAGAIAMFQLDGGLILALYPRSELAKDANISVGAPRSGEFSIGHLVDSKARGRPTARPGRNGWRDSHRPTA